AHAACRSASGTAATGGVPFSGTPRFDGGRYASSFSARTRGLSPAWIERIASSTMYRWFTSVADISLSLLPTGRNSRLALDTPYNVAMNAPEIAGPRVDGADRFSRTWISPMTVPMIPRVGAK